MSMKTMTQTKSSRDLEKARPYSSTQVLSSPTLTEESQLNFKETLLNSLAQLNKIWDKGLSLVFVIISASNSRVKSDKHLKTFLCSGNNSKHPKKLVLMVWLPLIWMDRWLKICFQELLLNLASEEEIFQCDFDLLLTIFD